MVVDVGHHEHRDCPAPGRLARLEDAAAVLRGLGTVERTRSVELARIVREHEDHPSGDVGDGVVVVVERGSRDAEPDEGDGAAGRAGGTEALWVEIVAQSCRRWRRAGSVDVEGVGVGGTERRHDQVERLQVAAVGRTCEAEQLEARPDEVGRLLVLRGAGKAPAALIGGEIGHVAAQVGGANRRAAGGRPLGGGRRRGAGKRRREQQYGQRAAATGEPRSRNRAVRGGTSRHRWR